MKENIFFIKKRIIIAIIITIIVLLLTNKYWFITKSLSVNFDISANNNFNTSVQLNRLNDDKFTLITSKSKILNLNGTTHIYMPFEQIKNVRKIKIILSNLSSYTPITITNLQIKNIKIEDANKLKIDGAKYKNNNNKLILIPYEKNITIKYNNELNIKPDKEFDYKVFTIILILTYLFAYKIANYIADFNTIKGNSKLEILFLTIFFILLCIPMLHINNNEFSKQENRALAKYKPFFLKDNKINYNYGKDFNTWFNDRFTFRKYFIWMYNSAKFLITSQGSKGIYDKKTGHMFVTYQFETIKRNELEKNINMLNRFNDWCKEHNISLYVLIVPEKTAIYETQNSNFKIDKNLHNEFIDYIKKINDIKIIYPYTELKKEAENNYVYFKTEHHWTDDGAFIGYKVLMNEIKKDYPNIKLLTENDFNYSYNNLIRGDFFRDFKYGISIKMLGLPMAAKYHKTKYRYYTMKDHNNLKENLIYKDFHMGKLYHYDKGSDYRVIQLGTSQNENLTGFIPYTFKDVKRLRINNVKNITYEDEFKIMKYYEQEMLNYKPDIIIFCITYTNIVRLYDLFNME